MKTIAEIREEMYRDKYEHFPYIKDWKKNPYTWFKAKLYMEAGIILGFFLLKTKIRPNTITIAYGLLGLIGGVLLAIPINQTILIAILIFFLKGILDWTDGLVARIKNQVSITGSILDPYSGFLGALGLQIGLGFYVAQKSGMMIFYYLIPLIPLFYAGKLHSFATDMLFNEFISSKKIKEYRKNNMSNSIQSKVEKPSEVLGKKYSKIYNLIKNFLDDRARTVDFICLLLLLEMFTPVFITWIIFLGYIVKRFIIFFISFYIVAKKDWAEDQFKSKIEEIFTVFESDN